MPCTVDYYLCDTKFIGKHEMYYKCFEGKNCAFWGYFFSYMYYK